MRFTEISESTVAGSISTVSMPMMTQTRENVSVPGIKPVEYLMKGKVKKKGSYGNSIAESKVNEEDISEQDLIIVPGQGRTSKTGLIKHGQSRLDHEVEMARSDLFSAAKNAKKVFNMIKDVSEEEGLEGWVQEKIIKANDYLNTIREYLEGKQLQGMTEDSSNPYGYKKGQTVKLHNGGQGRVLDIFDDSIEVLLPGGRTVTVAFQDATVIDEQRMEEGYFSDMDVQKKDKQYAGTQAYHVKRKAEKEKNAADAKKSFDAMFGGGNPANALKIKKQGVA